MSHPASSWGDGLVTNNSSLIVPRPTNASRLSPLESLHQYPLGGDGAPGRGGLATGPSFCGAPLPQGRTSSPNEPANLRFTESSDEYGSNLTRENLERHKERYQPPTATPVEDEDVIAEAVGDAVPRHHQWSLSHGWRQLTTKAPRSFRFFGERVRAMTWKQLLWVSFLVLLVMAGNAMQILMLNFWLHIFQQAGIDGNYTAFAVPGILFSLFFVIVLAVYVLVKRPNLKFASHTYGWMLLIGVGFCDTFNSWLATYAASHTSEVLQALFTNLCPLYAVFMSKWILHDPRTYLNVWIVAVFVLTIVGILVASVYGVVVAGDMGEGKIWIFIFFLSIPFRVLMNVWQSLYMIVYTRDPVFTEWLGRRFWGGQRPGAANGADAHGGSPEGGPQKGQDGGDAVSGAPGVPLQLDHGVAEDIVLDDALDDEREGSARMILAPPPSACPSELPEDRERYASANVSFGQRRGHVDPYNSNHHCASLPPTRASTRLTRNNDAEARPPPTAPAPPQEIVSIRYHQGEDMIVKLVMLAGETTAQISFTLALLPADALPWWGNSKTASEAWDSFAEGIVCVFTVRDNFLFGFLYTLGFVFTYVGCAYLNHYSVALCSIVSQLSSPLTALLLVLVPSWNVQGGGDESPWYMSVIAIILLSLAAFVYVIWEEQTDAEKVEGERVLKMKKLRVRPLEPEATVPSAHGPL